MREKLKGPACALLTTEVVCHKCHSIFSLIDEGDLFFIRGDFAVPYVFCRSCFSHPDEIITYPDETDQIDLFST